MSDMSECSSQVLLLSASRKIKTIDWNGKASDLLKDSKAHAFML